MPSLVYFFKEALIGFKRNFSTTLGSIVTTFLSLLLIGVFVLGGLIVEHIVSSVEDEVSITAYISDEYSGVGEASLDIQNLENYIRSLDGVSTVEFVSKDQALIKFKDQMSSNPDIVEQLNGNPLPASLEVQLSTPQLVTDVANKIQGNDSFTKVCDDPASPENSIKYGQKTVERLFSFTKYVRYIGIALVVLLIFIAMIFINNTIRLAILARRKEISIMRLVGASNGFIRGPFLMEGALHSVIGSLLAVIVLEILRRTIIPQISSGLIWLPIDIGITPYVITYLLLIIVGVIIGLLGSMFAMRRYLKV